MIRRLLSFLVVAALASTSLMAQGSGELLDTVRQNLVELQFESAIATLETLLAQPGLSVDERTDALVLRSQAHVAFGDLDAAEHDYREILTLRAWYVPNSNLTPRKAMARFEKVQAKLIGRFVIESAPADAQISIDGEPLVLDSLGSVAILAGEYDLRAEREGYDPYEQHVIVVGGGETPVVFALVPNARTLIIETEPADVEVWLDGTAVGVTARPEGRSNLTARLVLENLPLGDHRIDLRKPCFRDARFDEYLSVDLLDQSPRRIDLIQMIPSQSTVALTGGPAGADVVIDGQSVGRLPVDPYTVCPGKRLIEVRFADRVLWRSEPDLREATEITLAVVARPNAVLFGATEWPAGLSEFTEAFNTLEYRSMPRRFDPTREADWQGVDLPSGTDLAIAVVRASRQGARDRWFIYSPVLREASVMETAPAVAERPKWTTVVWGVQTIDSVTAGSTLVVGLSNALVPEGLGVGDQIVAVNGRAVTDTVMLRRTLAQFEDDPRVKIEWRKPSGEAGEGVLVGSVSPRLNVERTDLVEDVLRAAWAVVDAASTGDRSPTALANLALLLSQYGHHALAVETWQRVRWGDRRGVSEGTRQYYLGIELVRAGREDDAVAAFRAAAKSLATAFSDESPGVALAARDRLADLGVRSD